MSLLPAGLTRIERLPLTLSLAACAVLATLGVPVHALAHATWILENTMVSG